GGVPPGGGFGTAPMEPQYYYLRALQDAKDRYSSWNMANAALKDGKKGEVQEGKLGVDLSCENSNLRNQCRLTKTAVQRIGGRNALDVGGVWIDEDFDAKMPTVTVKAMSKAYFRMLELQPTMRDVFRLSNHLVWVTPSGTALVVDLNSGQEEMADPDIQKLFVKKK